ncbi:hypothetical protein HMPREF9102_0231 [Limosilactobacillus oris F0423]|uniref:Uncharacterized protein n=1 Tax=Limosilactobacillus oris F0423 TaxID=944562 RepID=A0ABP2LAL2_9LACO|nr:hypothetical protein HMPREF9102_0231 [Limosilactobacillus oris F0423]
MATTFKNPEKLREIYVPNNADPVKFSLRKILIFVSMLRYG